MFDCENVYEPYECAWIKNYLSTDEYILWQGKPEKGSLFSKKDIFLVPFSIIWCGFAIYWESSAILMDAPLLFKIFGIPFVFIGLYIVFGRFIMEKRKINHTYYAITNKKILRSQNGKIDVLDRNTLPSLHLLTGKSGRGTINFGNVSQALYYNNWNAWAHNGSFFQLKNISDVDKVWNILTEQT